LWQSGQPVDWWFAFKFNAETFPRPAASTPSCVFGGVPRGGHPAAKLGQSYVAASSAHPALAKGGGFLGDSTGDPLGATFDEVYNGTLSYVVWNDQFYRDPVLPCEGTTGNACGAPWAHAKGLVAWDADGNGLLLQVTTPSWPGSGSSAHPRQHDGNSLGCVQDDNVDLSQHFFALKLTKDDVLKLLAALQTEGVVTDLSISPKGSLTCTSSQNGRGGMFFVLEDQDLHDSVAALLAGKSAPLFHAAKKKAATHK